MATITPPFTVTTLVANGETEAFTSDALELTGYRGLVLFADAGGTPGTIVFERSRDSVEWENLPIYNTDGDLVSSTVSENNIWVGEVFDGVTFIRARVPDAWTGGAPLVQAVVIK